MTHVKAIFGFKHFGQKFTQYFPQDRDRVILNVQKLTLGCLCRCTHIHNERLLSAALCTVIVKTAGNFKLMKIFLYLWGKSSPPVAFPVELHFSALLISSSGCGTAMAWLMVHIWRLFHPAEMKEESGAQEVQEHPAGGTSPLSTTCFPDFLKFGELIKTRISDT